MAAGLTPRQSEALAFIRAYIAERKVSPTYQEIADALNISSKGGVARLVDALEQRGHIVRLKGGIRSLAPVDDAAHAVRLPRDLDRRVCSLAAARAIAPTVLIQEAVELYFAGRRAA